MEEVDDVLSADGEAQSKGEASTEDGGDDDEQAVAESFFWFCQAHGHEEQVGGDWQEDGLEEGNGDHGDRSVFMLSPAEYPFVESFVNLPAAWRGGPGDLIVHKSSSSGFGGRCQ